MDLKHHELDTNTLKDWYARSFDRYGHVVLSLEKNELIHVETYLTGITQLMLALDTKNISDSDTKKDFKIMSNNVKILKAHLIRDVNKKINIVQQGVQVQGVPVQNVMCNTQMDRPLLGGKRRTKKKSKKASKK